MSVAEFYTLKHTLIDQYWNGEISFVDFCEQHKQLTLKLKFGI